VPSLAARILPHRAGACRLRSRTTVYTTVRMSSNAALENLVRVRALIEASYAEPLDVAALAGMARLSPAHFSRAFSRAFGVSPHQYVIARRMERAALLLRTTDRPVGDVCRSVGLRSVGSFSTRFARTYGVSPTAYRAAGTRAPPVA
jgi:AraC-like DNA-binding protein